MEEEEVSLSDCLLPALPRAPNEISTESAPASFLSQTLDQDRVKGLSSSSTTQDKLNTSVPSRTPRRESQPSLATPLSPSEKKAKALNDSDRMQRSKVNSSRTRTAESLQAKSDKGRTLSSEKSRVAFTEEDSGRARGGGGAVKVKIVQAEGEKPKGGGVSDGETLKKSHSAHDLPKAISEGSLTRLEDSARLSERKVSEEDSKTKLKKSVSTMSPRFPADSGKSPRDDSSALKTNLKTKMSLKTLTHTPKKMTEPTSAEIKAIMAECDLIKGEKTQQSFRVSLIQPSKSIRNMKKITDSKYLGILLKTQYRCIFKSEQQSLVVPIQISLPYNEISEILDLEIDKTSRIIAVRCKTFVSYVFEFSNVEDYTAFKQLPNGVIYCWSTNNTQFCDHYHIYDPAQELALLSQGITECCWDVCNLNEEFELSKEYGAAFILPKIYAQDKEGLSFVSALRWRNRFPVLSWGDFKNNIFLMRAKRPKLPTPSLALPEFLPENRTAYSTYMDRKKEDIQHYDLDFIGNLWDIINSNNQPNQQDKLIHVYDFGEKDSALNALYHSYCEYHFVVKESQNPNDFRLNIDQSIEKLINICQETYDPETLCVEAEKTDWSYLLRETLVITTDILTQLQKNTVIIQTTENDDMDVVYSSLIQILQYPYYRTLEGFCKLVDKEWLCFGHPFTKNIKIRGFSHIFLHFICCLYQIYQEYTTAFEFSTNLLSFLMDSSINHRFFNFLFNQESQRVYEFSKNKILAQGPSIWSYILSKKANFINPFYIPNPQVLYPSANRSAQYYEFLFKQNLVVNERLWEYYKVIKKVTGSGEVKELKELNICKCGLFYLPDAFHNYPSLTQLTITENRLMALPTSIAHLTSLTHLNLSSNRLTIIPSVVLDKMVHLKVFLIQANRLVNLQESIGNLRQLEKLDLSNNRLVGLPISLGQLPFLKTLNLSWNHSLSRLPSSFIYLSCLNSLSLSNCGFQHLPARLMRSLISLTELDISLNKIYTMPDVSNMHNLVVLWMRNNKIGEITEAIGKCTSLTLLDSRENSITKVSEEIGKCQSLTRIDLSANCLSEIPVLMGQCVTIKQLNLSYNKLRNIPLLLRNCSRLEKLELQYNQLETISHGIGHLKALVYLDLNCNNLTVLPPTLAYLNNSLEYLDVNNNVKLKSPPARVVKNGCKAILEHLKDLLESNNENYRIKMLVIGQENVGKTTLIQHLTDKWESVTSFVSVKKEKNISTDGIDIGSYQFDYIDSKSSKVFRKKKKVTVSIWDFAGQDVYLITHRLFLSNRALYLLVFNLEEPISSQIDYWLSSISSRIQKAKIIIVGTHSEALTTEVVESRLKIVREHCIDNFPSDFIIYSQLGVSCTTGAGITLLREVVQLAICKQRFMGEVLPTSYSMLERFLCDYREDVREYPVIDMRQVECFAKLCGISDKDVVIDSMRVLNEYGSIVYFNESKLKDFVILNPHWLTKMMASIFTTKHNWIKNGILSHSTLSHMWKEYPPEIHSRLLLLIEKFEIAFFLSPSQRNNLSHIISMCPPSELEESMPPKLNDYNMLDKNDVSLIPALLGKERPHMIIESLLFEKSAQSKEKTTFARKFRFSIVPVGFITKLIYRFLSFGGDVFSLWGNGLLLTNLDNTVQPESQSVTRPTTDSLVLIEVSKTDQNATENQLDLVLVHVDEPRAIHYFQLAMDIVLNVVSYWPNSEWKTYVPYPPLQDPTDKNGQSLISTVELEQYVIMGKRNYQLKMDMVKPIAKLAPDISLANYGGVMVPFSSMEILKTVGEGAFATVYHGKRKGTDIAIKKLTTASRSVTFSTLFWEYRKEIFIHNLLHHQNIIELCGICIDPFCMILEYASVGNLYNYINSVAPLVWPLKIRIAADIASAIHYMHSNCIVHFDLKSPNVMLCSVEPNEVCAKVTDFGTAFLAKDNETLVAPEVDNPIWLAPEIMKKDTLSEKVDTYAFGVIIWELVARAKFFEELSFMSEIIEAVSKGERPKIPPGTPEEWASLVTKCWSQSPADRPAWPYVIDYLEDLKKLAPQFQIQTSATEQEIIKKIENDAENVVMIYHDNKTNTMDGSDSIDVLVTNELSMLISNKKETNLTSSSSTPKSSTPTRRNVSGKYQWEQLFGSDEAVEAFYSQLTEIEGTCLKFYLICKERKEESGGERRRKTCEGGKKNEGGEKGRKTMGTAEELREMEVDEVELIEKLIMDEPQVMSEILGVDLTTNGRPPLREIYIAVEKYLKGQWTKWMDPIPEETGPTPRKSVLGYLKDKKEKMKGSNSKKKKKD